MPFLRLAHPGGRSNFLGWPQVLRSALVPEGCQEEAQLQVRDAWDASRSDVLRLVLPVQLLGKITHIHVFD